jgi:hypothetical protein
MAGGDYAYWFSGTFNIVRRLYLARLGISNPGLPAADGTRQWEKVADMPASTVLYPYCAIVPSNSNQIVLEVSGSTTISALLYDIYKKTFTTVPYSSTSLYTSPLNELCHAYPPRLYAFPYSTTTGAKVYDPSPAVAGSSNWPTVISAGALKATRTYPSVVLVPAAFTTAAGITCSGC